ncbi:MAG TPA: NAD(P)H-hydrate dehydratase [Mycobacteriales bacterium]|nr:NAD(P)H-hydrate dehydratase [Mycobacteriales bacterium]
MRLAHTVAQVRAAEEPLLAAGVPLMARASTALAVVVAGRLPAVYGARVVLLAGPGNNGADALYAGAWLARRGAAVVAVPTGDLVPHALDALLQAGGRVGTADALAGAEVVLDGLVGIGGKGPLRPPAAELVAAVGPGLRVAVDVPSGVDADTGAVGETAFRADLTVTFGSLKPGLLLAREHVGELVLADIGLELPTPTAEVLEARDVLGLLRRPRSTDDKYRRGVVGVVAGSSTYTGAAVLAVGSALAAGAGMVRYVGEVEAVRVRWPEAVVSADLAGTGRVQAWVVGPGLGLDRMDVLADVLDRPEPVVVDADALTLCAQHPYLLERREGATVVTPHDREYERFGPPVGQDRIAAACGFAARHGVHVLLKGDATVVAAPDGRVRVNPTGSPYLASAGTGDVLAGALGSLLAQGLEPLDAASVAAYVHGLAGDRTRAGAGALIGAWPGVVRGLEG